MTSDNLLGLWREPYTSRNGPVGGHVYRQAATETWQQFLISTFAELADWYGELPPVGSACITLKSWISDGEVQRDIRICQDPGESIDDWLDRAKRTFSAALLDHPPD